MKMESSYGCMNGDVTLNNCLYIKVKDRVYYCAKGINYHCFRAQYENCLATNTNDRKE